MEIQAKYQGYIDRQKEEVTKMAGLEGIQIPEEMDYINVSGLSAEAKQKLAFGRPSTLGQASRISGITPAAIGILLVHIKRANRSSQDRSSHSRVVS